MRTLFAVALMLHAAVHGLAFAATYEVGPHHSRLRAYLATLDNGEQGAKLLGVAWAAVGSALSVASVASLFAPSWWPTFCAASLMTSLCLCLAEWPISSAARAGAAVNAVMLAMLWSSHLLDIVL